MKVNLRVTGHCNQGGRKYMEDFFSVAYQQSKDENKLEYAFFGIFDGHGGSEAASFAKEHLMRLIVCQKQFWSTDNDDDVLRAIREGFSATHNAMWKEQEKWPRTPTGLPSTAGTTATIAFIRNGKIYIGHVGDSGIALGYQGDTAYEWKARPLTQDHKPECHTEMARIHRTGGKVVCKSGVSRVVWIRPKLGHKGPIRRSTPIDEIPFLAVARSLGDLWSYNSELNEFVVSPEPDVHVIKIDKSFRCLIFGTDGLWNVMTAKGAVEVVQKAELANDRNFYLEQGREMLNPSRCLVDKALEKWSMTRMRADNTSVVTIMLDPPGPPKRDLMKQNQEFGQLSCFHNELDGSEQTLGEVNDDSNNIPSEPSYYQQNLFSDQPSTSSGMFEPYFYTTESYHNYMNVGNFNPNQDFHQGQGLMMDQSQNLPNFSNLISNEDSSYSLTKLETRIEQMTSSYHHQQQLQHHHHRDLVETNDPSFCNQIDLNTINTFHDYAGAMNLFNPCCSDCDTYQEPQPVEQQSHQYQEWVQEEEEEVLNQWPENENSKEVEEESIQINEISSSVSVPTPPPAKEDNLEEVDADLEPQKRKKHQMRTNSKIILNNAKKGPKITTCEGVSLRKRPSNQKENLQISSPVTRRLKLNQKSIQIGNNPTPRRSCTRSQSIKLITTKALRSKNSQSALKPQATPMETRKNSKLNLFNSQDVVTSTTSQLKRISKKATASKTMTWSVTKSTVQTRNRVQKRLNH